MRDADDQKGIKSSPHPGDEPSVESELEFGKKSPHIHGDEPKKAIERRDDKMSTPLHGDEPMIAKVPELIISCSPLPWG